MMPSTEIIAAMPIAIPSAVSKVLVFRVLRPNVPTKSESLRATRLELFTSFIVFSNRFSLHHQAR